MTFLILTTIIVLFVLYNRYFPVYGVRYINVEALDLYNMNVIDVRDFDESYRNAVVGAINIPIAYLNRNIKEIPKEDLFVVASNSLEKNVGIRLLRKKGFRVIGFSIHNKQELLLNTKVLGANSGLGEQMDENRVSVCNKI
ncbi:rhodanese-like domain-containing protein [Bacillus marasmi]|uniref:rhodanese-like domain-containing protein n=1 Tax=Bacillus marasmi TaxID=1926279 RepID=UPI00164E339E|nr:hypothetical protein [Bacillus marasmi]